MNSIGRQYPLVPGTTFPPRARPEYYPPPVIDRTDVFCTTELNRKSHPKEEAPV
jgi:hypothetical protein